MIDGGVTDGEDTFILSHLFREARRLVPFRAGFIYLVLPRGIHLIVGG